MISLAEKVNEEVETNTTHVDEAVTTANGASQKATKASEEVQKAITEANTTLQEANAAKVSAQESATASAGSASAAAGSASAASGSAANAAASAKAVEDIAAGLGGFDGTATSVKATDTQGIVVAAGADSNAQALLDALARKVALELVSNTALTTKLADYLKKTDIVQTESTATNKVPSSAYLKQVKDSIDSNLASIGTGTQLATLSMNNKSITGISFNDYKTVEIMVIIQQASNGNMFFNFTLVPLVSHILDGTRYITIPGKSYGYCANVLLSINYSAGTVTLIEADANEGFGLNAIYILGLK